MHPVPKHDSRTVCLCERCNYMPSSEHRMHGECEDLTPRYRLCKNACTNSIIIIYEYDNTYIALNAPFKWFTVNFNVDFPSGINTCLSYI